jgi:rhomboid protease GluP
MAELVGRRCARCSQVINTVAEAEFCPQCGRAVHIHCEPAGGPPDPRTACPVCGSDLSRSPTATLRLTELPAFPGDADSHRPEDEGTAFQRLLVAMTPRVYVTRALVAINVGVFVLMVASGVSAISPSGEDLVRWGADFGPKTLAGEWWRLLTATVVHVGVLHIAFNMWVLLAAGPLVERLLGNVGFLVLYVVAGLTGSVTSLLWNPMLVSAGASGAIFGLFGALVAVALRQRGSIPMEQVTQLRNSGLAFVAYNLVFGLFLPNIDVAAHLGGLAGGFLGGLVLRQPLRPEARAGRPVRNALLVGLGVVLILGGVFAVSARHADLVTVLAELDRFEAVEDQARGTLREAAERAERRELTDRAVADTVEREVLPEWKATRQRLAAVGHVPATLQAHVAGVLEYMRLREEGWELLVRGLREGNGEVIRQASERQAAADEVAKRLTDKAGK